METTNRLSRPHRLKIFETTGAIGTIRTIIWSPGSVANKQQPRAAHLFVHFFSGRFFARLQRETS